MVKFVKVKNKGKVLVDNVKYCDSFWSRVQGLMFSKKRSAILVSDRESKEATSIHMFFVFFSLDIFWLDKDYRVVDFKTVRPFEPLIVPGEKAQFVLEVPKGQITGDLVGDKLEIE